MSNVDPSDLTEMNLRKLTALKAKNPQMTHVYLKRHGKDGATVDIPVTQAEFTIKMWPKWELVSSNEDMDAEVAALFKEPPTVLEPDIEIPPKPSEVTKPIRTHRQPRNKPKARATSHRPNKKA